MDRRHRGHCRMRNSDHGIPWTDSASPQSHMQSIRSATDSHCMTYSEVTRKLLFKRRDFLCENVTTAVQHAMDGLINLILVREVISLGIHRREQRMWGHTELSRISQTRS